MQERFNKFSVPLGLLDYINPILYSITIITIIKNILFYLIVPYRIILILGAVLSIIFGFAIPTIKVLIGLKVIEFKLPVPFVFLVNTGIFLSGLMLFKYSFHTKYLIILFLILVILLAIIYLKTKKINTVAVLTGAIGYLLTYISLIALSIRKLKIIPIFMYAAAIVIFVILCGIGIKGDLKNPKVHWVIEISNVICQLLVAIATIMIFK